MARRRRWKKGSNKARKRSTRAERLRCSSAGRHFQTRRSFMSNFSTMGWFYRLAYNIVGIELFFHRIKIEGRENVPPGGCLIVSNHVSFMDPTTVGGAVARE